MVTTGDQLATVRKREAIREFYRRPVREHPSTHVSALLAAWLGAVDLITDAQLGDPPDPSVRKQHERLANHAVRAGMAAASVWIDRPPERHRTTGHLVQ